MPVSTPKYKNLFCQTLKKQVLIRGFLLYLKEKNCTYWLYKINTVRVSELKRRNRRGYFSYFKFAPVLKARLKQPA